MEYLFDELEYLKYSYNEDEFCNFVSNKTQYLKFTLWKNGSITFEIPATYPTVPPLISLSFSMLTNNERAAYEKELRDVAVDNIGSPMITSLVMKLQEIIDAHIKNTASAEPLCEQDNYTCVIQIDHMRQKKKYSKSLTGWASDLNINGILLFCQKWIFLIIQGSQKSVKEFTTRLRTVCVDVDSSGKPCKEKMSKILFEGVGDNSFVNFSIEEMETVEDLKKYLSSSNSQNIFDIIKPELLK